MDLRLHMRVIWRFRLVAALGLLLAAGLAFLSVARVDIGKHSVTYRTSEQWISYAHVFVTQSGFPYGSINPNGPNPAALTTDAVLYSQFAVSDPVLKLAFGKTKPPGTIDAAPLLTATTGEPLPIVSIAATAATPALAKELALDEMNGLIRYVKGLQARNEISDADRVQLEVIQYPANASLAKGRSLTLPIVVFLTALLAVVGLCFILENLRPLPAKDGTGPISLPRAENLA
jgi:hypothetical protein